MVLLMLPLSFSHQDCSQSLFVLAQPSWLCYSHPDKSALKPQDEMITSQLYEWMYACPLQGYRTLSPRLSANIGRSDSYRLSSIILNCTQLYYNSISPFSVLYSQFIKHQKIWHMAAEWFDYVRWHLISFGGIVKNFWPKFSQIWGKFKKVCFEKDGDSRCVGVALGGSRPLTVTTWRPDRFWRGAGHHE